MSDGPGIILPFSEGHIPQVAQLHMKALAGDFLPSLGAAFLRAFYRGALQSGQAFGFVSLDDQEVTGFVLGSADTSQLFRRVLLRSAPALALAALPAVLRRPALLLKVAETFLYPQREGQVSEPAELVVIAVAENQRGKRIGEALVGALDTALVAQNIGAYKVTVLDANAGANRFYRRLGFVAAGDFRLYGRAWNLYIRRINPPPVA